MFKIRLENTKDAEEFVREASKCGGDVDLHSGVVYIDGKSLLGVLAMGIKRDMDVSLTLQKLKYLSKPLRSSLLHKTE